MATRLPSSLAWRHRETRHRPCRRRRRPEGRPSETGGPRAAPEQSLLPGSAAPLGRTCPAAAHVPGSGGRFSPQRPGIRVKRLRGASHLAAQPRIGLIADSDLRRRVVFNEPRGETLRRVHEHADRVFLREAVKRRGVGGAARGDQISRIDMSLHDRAGERGLDRLEPRQRRETIDLGLLQLDLRASSVQIRVGLGFFRPS